MIQLRTWICMFLLWLVLFFNVERLIPQVNLASFVYIYPLVLAIFVLFLPDLVKKISGIPIMVVTLVLFFILKSAFGYQILGDNFPITITEIASIIVTYLLARNISTLVSDFEETISNLTFQQIGLPPRLYNTTDTEDLYREVKRSRRFQHPLALMKVRLKQRPKEGGGLPPRLLKEMQRALFFRYFQVRLAKLYSDKLRDTDLVVLKKDELVVMLPETTQENAMKLMENLKTQAANELGLSLACGLAAFPEHSVTLNGLMEYASSDLDQVLEGKDLGRG